MKKILFSIAMLVVTTAVFSQNCIRVVKPTAFSGPASNGTFSLTVFYEAEGNKNLETVVKCGGTVVNSYCLDASGNGTITYSGIVCAGGISALTATFTPHTGACNSAQCGPIQIFPELGPGGGPLPVKLSAFSAVRSKQVVSLNWNTEFEIDTKEFVVERAEGTDFRSIGTISSNGNSSTKKSYSFNDKNDNAGTTYYRLKNVDLNGKFTYSDVRIVKGIGATSDVTIFPNPARSNSKISVVGVTASSTVQLLDFSGKVLKNLNSTNVNSMDLTGVKNGTYLIRIIDKVTNQIVNKSLTVNN